MKKNMKKAVCIAVLCVMAALLVWRLTDCATVRVGDEMHELSLAESWQVRSLLGMKKYEFTGYGCPFSETYSVEIGGLTYCIATDDCESVYIQQLNLYYLISPGNKTALEEIMDQYR